MLKKLRISKVLKYFQGSRGILFAILLLALALRVWGIDSRDIWYDELLTIQQSEKSISEINVDVPTPIHYYFVHLFLFFGKSTSVLGLPSVIFGLLTVLLVFLTAKRIADERVGLVAAFLLAISPMHIEFSQQILFFSYFVFFSLLSFYFLLNFIFSLSKNSIAWWSLLFFVISCWINIHTQMMALVVTAIESIILTIFLLT